VMQLAHPTCDVRVCFFPEDLAKSIKNVAGTLCVVFAHDGACERSSTHITYAKHRTTAVHSTRQLRVNSGAQSRRLLFGCRLSLRAECSELYPHCRCTAVRAEPIAHIQANANCIFANRTWRGRKWTRARQSGGWDASALSYAAIFPGV